MKKYLTQFERVPVGAVFYRNGNTYTKTTTRTATLHKYDRRFYFGMRENVEVTVNSLLKG